MGDEFAYPSAPAFLVSAYPDERQRVHAERWLGLLARQADGASGAPLAWWRAVPLVPVRLLVNIRMVASTLLIMAMFIPGVIFVLADSTAFPALGGMATVFVMLRIWLWSAKRRREDGTDMDVPWASAAGSAREARRDCVRRGLAWAPSGALLGLLSAPNGSGAWTLLVAVAYAVGIAVLAALNTGTYPLAVLAEALLTAGWGERPAFGTLLAGAEDRQVLRRVRGGFEFHENLRDYLVRKGEAALAEHQRAIRARLSSPWGRRLAAAWVTRRGIFRVSLDAGAGAGIAAAIVGAALLSFYGNLAHWGWVLVVPVAVLAGAVGAGTFFGLRAAAALARLAAGWVPGWPRRVRLTLVAAVIAAAGLLVGTEGPALAGIVAFCLPLALVAGCGAWTCAFLLRSAGDGRRRWLRPAADAVAVATVAGFLLVLVRHSLLTAEPAAGLLFPVAVWGTFRLWRAMAGSGRLAVKAAANIVGSLLLGGELVLLLVWLGNVLSFSVPVVAAVRWWLEQIGSRADLPWWAWTSLYAVLAGLGIAIVRWRDRMKRVATRLTRLAVAPAASATQQVLSCVHIGLLAIVLVGLTAPPAMAQVLTRQLSHAYVVALQREFDDAAEIYAYHDIFRHFRDGSRDRATLIAMISKVSKVAGPGDPRQGATSTEEALAWRLGEAQAQALALPAVPSLVGTERQDAAAAGFVAADGSTAGTPSSTSGDETSLAGQAQVLTERDQANEAQDKAVEQAADLAARLVASTISIPSVSGDEVFQVVREYLGGLIEGSRLTNVFAAWLKSPGRAAPPSANTIVTPDPRRLEAAAVATLSRVTTEQGMDDPVTDPDNSDYAYQNAQDEDPIDAAVDIVNDARYAQDPTGPCDNCIAPGVPGIGKLWQDINKAPAGPGGQDSPGEPGEEPVQHEPEP